MSARWRCRKRALSGSRAWKSSSTSSNHTSCLSLPLTFTKRDAGDLLIQATAHYQACSASDCLMPATIELVLPVAFRTERRLRFEE